MPGRATHPFLGSPRRHSRWAVASTQDTVIRPWPHSCPTGSAPDNSTNPDAGPHGTIRTAAGASDAGSSRPPTSVWNLLALPGVPKPAHLDGLATGASPPPSGRPRGVLGRDDFSQAALVGPVPLCAISAGECRPLRRNAHRAGRDHRGLLVRIPRDGASVAFAAIAPQLDVLGRTFIRRFAQPQVATRYGVRALTRLPHWVVTAETRPAPSPRPCR
jgi:hypothetical protein